jgi:hypothetical protein
MSSVCCLRRMGSAASLQLVKSCSAASDHLNDVPIVLIKGQESRFQAPAIAPSRPKRRRLGRRSRRTRAGSYVGAHQGPLADAPCRPRACAPRRRRITQWSVSRLGWTSVMIGRTSAANCAACVGVGPACALAGEPAKANMQASSGPAMRGIAGFVLFEDNKTRGAAGRTRSVLS